MKNEHISDGHVWFYEQEASLKLLTIHEAGLSAQPCDPPCLSSPVRPRKPGSWWGGLVGGWLCLFAEASAH